ncbi:MAG: hypothetical protein V1846_04635 [Candidatus Komeilibacteria bacterium]
MKLNTLKFALAAGIYGALCFGLVTIAALIGIPGLRPFADLLAQFYSAYGYSVSWFGVIMAVIWGFIEGFCHFGFFAWVYNKLVK